LKAELENHTIEERECSYINARGHHRTRVGYVLTVPLGSGNSGEQSGKSPHPSPVPPTPKGVRGGTVRTGLRQIGNGGER
jgi:hypothetical protein